ncbi:hypothetical protein LTR17_003847 [Elasticomyces elasticus]|nr:hypothetical protein LTR17_003847 [Elasticomyces elasticus]
MVIMQINLLGMPFKGMSTAGTRSTQRHTPNPLNYPIVSQQAVHCSTWTTGLVPSMLWHIYGNTASASGMYATIAQRVRDWFSHLTQQSSQSQSVADIFTVHCVNTPYEETDLNPPDDVQACGQSDPIHTYSAHMTPLLVDHDDAAC